MILAIAIPIIVAVVVILAAWAWRGEIDGFIRSIERY